MTPTASTTPAADATTSSAQPPRLDHIRAISFDLDDTLWPFLPVILQAEQVLRDWLLAQAPGTVPLLTARPAVLRELREVVQQERPDLAHDLSGMRRESIRRLLVQVG